MILKRKDYGKLHKPFNLKEHMAKYWINHRKELKEKHAEWRARNSEHLKEYEAEKYKERKKFILSYNVKWLMDHGHYSDSKFYCPECGKEIDVTQVHNHHIEPESKLFDISQCGNRSYETLEAELVKTEPICPQCHKLITAKERNHHIFKELNSMTNAELIVKFSEHVQPFTRRRKK